MSFLTCRTIEINYGKGTLVKAILTISQQDDDRILLTVAEEGQQQGVYEAVYSSKQIQQELKEDSIDKWLSYFSTQDNEQVQTTFKCPEQGVLQIIVLERMESGLNRKAWNSGELHRDKSKSIFSFCTALVDSIHHEKDNNQKLQSLIESLKERLDQWKDTAEKLDGQWQKEKSKLFNNFLILYNEKQDQVKELEKEIEQLQKQRDHARKSVVGRQPQPDFLVNLPDDQDTNLHDKETVTRLAAGRPMDVSKGKSAQPKKGEDDSPPYKKMRVNPVLGCKEYDGPDALFQDKSLFPDNAKDSDDDSDEGPKDSKKRAAKGRSTGLVKSTPPQPPKRPRGRSVKKEPPKPRDKEEDLSSSSEPEVDPALRASIRAQMEAFKNAGWSSSDDDDENARAKI